jgi:plasmid stabilization system protein ParE
VRVLRVLPAADRDTDEAADHLVKEASLEVALRFMAAVESTYELILEHPLSERRGPTWRPMARMSAL